MQQYYWNSTLIDSWMQAMRFGTSTSSDNNISLAPLYLG